MTLGSLCAENIKPLDYTKYMTWSVSRAGVTIRMILSHDTTNRWVVIIVAGVPGTIVQSHSAYL